MEFKLEIINKLNYTPTWRQKEIDIQKKRNIINTMKNLQKESIIIVNPNSNRNYQLHELLNLFGNPNNTTPVTGNHLLELKKYLNGLDNLPTNTQFTILDLNAKKTQFPKKSIYCLSYKQISTLIIMELLRVA